MSVFWGPLGVKLDVDNPGSRFLMTFAFVLIHRFVYMAISLQLVGGSEAWMWSHTLLSALVNGLAAVVLFIRLDKLKLRIRSPESLRRVCNPSVTASGLCLTALRNDLR